MFSIGIALSGITSGTLLGLFTIGMVRRLRSSVIKCITNFSLRYRFPKSSTPKALCGDRLCQFWLSRSSPSAHRSISMKATYATRLFHSMSSNATHPLESRERNFFIAVCIYLELSEFLGQQMQLFTSRTQVSITRRSIGFSASTTCTTGTSRQLAMETNSNSISFNTFSSVIGTVLVILVGYPISLLTGGTKDLDPMLLSPLFRRFYKRNLEKS